MIEAIQERLAQHAITAASRMVRDRERNRREMPETTAILDGLKRVGIWPPKAFEFTEHGRTVTYTQETQ